MEYWLTIKQYCLMIRAAFKSEDLNEILFDSKELDIQPVIQTMFHRDTVWLFSRAMKANCIMTG